MDPLQWLSLFAVCLLGAMSPGASLAIVIANTMNGGRLAGIQTAVAHGLGVALYGVLTVSGFALIITQSPSLFTGIQVVGSVYLLWLGVSALRTSTAGGVESSRGGSGFLIAFLNPKLAIFMLAVFSQFLSVSADTTEKALMVATVGLTDAAWYAIVAMLVSQRSIMPWLEARYSTIGRLFGAILIVLGVSVLVRVLTTVSAV
ncbi:transporter, LysE family [Luminiphilus syltensis NOR5-1B]|uniref:Transporter, LysE family n=1 Tax=Luminiphilus syltensis NOR5-1B TaxID=565045 RepID=B8KWP3_9GAMM|nr:LysE family translocator [Luminiphilus syltensis]EED34258.1 transporter, LysE family [Luminiphilus syltensis NOR5-1B]